MNSDGDGEGDRVNRQGNWKGNIVKLMNDATSTKETTISRKRMTSSRTGQLHERAPMFPRIHSDSIYRAFPPSVFHRKYNT